MPWFKVDDTFYDHPKVKKLSSHAVRLWLMSGSRSAHYLLDGWVDRTFVNTFPNGSRSARALVAANLWYEGERDGEPGWFFHDWADYQPMRADVERRRQQTRERVEKHRGNAVTNAACNAVSNAGCNAAPDPTRPDPLVVGSGNQPHQRNHSPAGATSAKSARAGPPDDWLEAIADCDLCNDEGLRLPAAMFKCDHVDRRQTHANGMAAIREQLNETKARKANQ
jgi:hypothetical protein